MHSYYVKSGKGRKRKERNFELFVLKPNKDYIF